METELDEKGSTAVFRIAKQRAKEKRDVVGMPCIQDEDGTARTEIKQRLEVWKRYSAKLMKTENPRNSKEDATPAQVSFQEVKEAWKMMKKGKSPGPSEVSSEMMANEVSWKELCSVANGLLKGEDMPESWKRSITIPLYKGKGNALECSNYRTIKLLEHGMKIS